MTHPTLAEMTARLHKLPAMPVVAAELLSSLASEDTEVDALARRIAQDQAIAARVLRVANSPFYGLQTQVGSIRDAIVVLGFSTVRSLVLTATVVSGLPAGRCPGFSQELFWRHGLGVAVAARALARKLGRRADELFIAGLLHDIGRLAMVVVAPEDYAEVIATSRAQDCTRQEAEMSVFGYDHAAVGAALAQRWNFPPRSTTPSPSTMPPPAVRRTARRPSSITPTPSPRPSTSTARRTRSCPASTRRPSSPWTSTNPAWPRC